MKKIILLAAAAVLALSGCSSLSPTLETVEDTLPAITQTEPVTEAPTQPPTTQEETSPIVVHIVPATTTEPETTTAPARSGRMEASSATFKSGNVKIDYPVLVGMSDEAAQEWANVAIYDDMRSILDLYDIDESADKLELAFDTKIIYKSEYSFVWSGTLTRADGDKVNIKLTDDLNLAQKKHMRLSDRLAAARIVKAIIEDDNYEVVYSPVGVDTLKQYLSAKPESFFTNLCESSDFGGTQTPAGFSYTQGGQVVMVVLLPHSLGDYAEIAIKQQTK